MSHRSRKTLGVVNSKLPREGDEKVAESRRGFLVLGGAAMVAGLVEACSNTGTGGAGAGGVLGSGGSATGGAGSGGMSGSGGMGSGGLMGSGGAMGGASGRGGASGLGGADGTGGIQGSGGSMANGGAQGSGGAAADGGVRRDGSAPGNGGAQGSGGASGQGGATGAGGTGAGGSGGTSNPTVKWPAENTGASCSVAAVPAVNNAKLPDPFKFFSGKRIATKEEWSCLRAELSAALQQGVYGPKMPKPDALTATYSGGSITINMTVGSNKQTMTVKVTGGGTAASPKGCVIACGMSSLPLSGFASINMDPNSVSSESNLSGIVKNLYGSACAKSGALIGWAWGCSRIIDALELCPEAGVDLKKIMVTGCSRYGKGALAMGAFDERVALTLMQEGGSGGSALWRVSTKEKSLGQNIQECGEISGEAKWQGSDFPGYCGNGSKIATLPCDQHFAVALCAPRAVLLIENDIDWLGPVAAYGGGVAGRKVFEALGIKDRCGATIRGNHSHCSFPSSQQADLTAFLDRFINGKSANTDIMVFQATNTKLGTFKEADWIDWDVPTLTGNLPFDPFA
jgi:hypothetical protein